MVDVFSPGLPLSEHYSLPVLGRPSPSPTRLWAVSARLRAIPDDVLSQTAQIFRVQPDRSSLTDTSLPTNFQPMDDYVQPDATDFMDAPPTNKRSGGGNSWRRNNPIASKAAVYRWRARHQAAYNDYMKRYMANKRLALRTNMDSND